jgi:hypothetical protein
VLEFETVEHKTGYERKNRNRRESRPREMLKCRPDTNGQREKRNDAEV